MAHSASRLPETRRQPGDIADDSVAAGSSGWRRRTYRQDGRPTVRALAAAQKKISLSHHERERVATVGAGRANAQHGLQGLVTFES
jgi:hypothetical protein